MTLAVFHDFPGLENGLTKFHDFPGRVLTLFLPAGCAFHHPTSMSDSDILVIKSL